MATGGSGAFQVDTSTANLTLSGVLSGAGNLIKTGPGLLTLNGSNTFTGSTNVNVGTLQITGSSAFAGGGSVNVASGAGFSYNAPTSAQLTIGGDFTFIGGAGSVLGTSVGSGTSASRILVAGSASTSGSYALSVSGIAGGTVTAGTYTLISGGAGSSLDGGTATLTLFNTTNFTVGSLIASATDIKLTVAPATALTSAYWRGGYVGGSNVWAASDGSANSNWVGSLGGAVQSLVPGVGAVVNISDSIISLAPTATVLGANMSILGLTISDTANAFGLNADGNALTLGSTGLTMNSGALTATIAADVVLGSAQTWANDSVNSLGISGALNNAGYGLTASGTGLTDISGIISGTGAVTKTGLGTLRLSGTNTFTGGLTINAGTVQLGNAGALNSTTPNSVTFGASAASGTKLQIFGNNVTIPILSTNATPGSPVVENGSLTAGTITYSSVSSGTFAGTLQDGTGGGALVLVKAGSGTFTLSGSNSYTGLTTLSAGTLRLAHSNALAGSGNLTFSGGTLQFGTLGATYSNSIVNSSTAILIDSNGQSGTMAGLIDASNTGGFSKAGSGTVIFSAANLYSGTLTINQGTVALSATPGVATNTLAFGNANGLTTTVGRLDLSTTSATFGSFSVLTNSISANTIVIGAGQALSVNGDFNVGNRTTNLANTLLTVSGSGALVINKANGTFNAGIGNGVAGQVIASTTDLSGLASFTASLPGGNFNVGANMDNNPNGLASLYLSNTSNKGTLKNKHLRN